MGKSLALACTRLTQVSKPTVASCVFANALVLMAKAAMLIMVLKFISFPGMLDCCPWVLSVRIVKRNHAAIAPYLITISMMASVITKLLLLMKLVTLCF